MRYGAPAVLYHLVVRLNLFFVLRASLDQFKKLRGDVSYVVLRQVGEFGLRRIVAMQGRREGFWAECPFIERKDRSVGHGVIDQFARSGVCRCIVEIDQKIGCRKALDQRLARQGVVEDDFSADMLLCIADHLGKTGFQIVDVEIRRRIPDPESGYRIVRRRRTSVWDSARREESL